MSLFCILLIEKAEHPQRDASAITGFDAVNSQVAVGGAGNLIEFLAFATYLEQVFPIHQEITLKWRLNGTDSGKLVDEESLSECADVNLGRKGVHQIGVAKVDLLWIYQLFIILEFYGEKLQNLGLIQIVKEFQQGILQLVSSEPVMVQGDVERFIRVAVFLLNPLQKHRGLTYATLSLDADDAGVPVDLGIKVTFEIQRNLGESTVVKLNNGANICQFHIYFFLKANI